MTQKTFQISDNAPRAMGYLSVYKDYHDGTPVQYHDGVRLNLKDMDDLQAVFENEKNVITYDSRRVHLQYLFDYDSAPKDEIQFFKVGQGGAVGNSGGGNDNNQVLPPDPNGNDLFDPLTGINNDITITPSDPTLDEVFIEVIFSVNQDEANGFSINECGLFKSSGNMFNHKTFTSIDKTDSFSLIFRWTIRYV